MDGVQTPDKPLSYRVQKMKLSKDKRDLIVNDTLTLRGIPAEVFEYRLGNRSALEWVIDQYQVEKDKAGNVVSDPNRQPPPPEAERYIVDLVGKVVRVSVRTVQIVKGLPESYGGPPNLGPTSTDGGACDAAEGQPAASATASPTETPHDEPKFELRPPKRQRQRRLDE